MRAARPQHAETLSTWGGARAAAFVVVGLALVLSACRGSGAPLAVDARIERAQAEYRRRETELRRLYPDRYVAIVVEPCGGSRLLVSTRDASWNDAYDKFKPHLPPDGAGGHVSDTYPEVASQ